MSSVLPQAGERRTVDAFFRAVSSNAPATAPAVTSGGKDPLPVSVVDDAVHEFDILIGDPEPQASPVEAPAAAEAASLVAAPGVASSMEAPASDTGNGERVAIEDRDEGEASLRPDSSANPGLSAFDPDVLQKAREAVGQRYREFVETAAQTLALQAREPVSFAELAAAVDYVIGVDRSGIRPTAAAEVESLLARHAEDGRVVTFGPSFVATEFASGIKAAIRAQFETSDKSHFASPEAIVHGVMEDHPHAHLDEEARGRVRGAILQHLGSMKDGGEMSTILRGAQVFYRPAGNVVLITVGDDGRVMDAVSGAPFPQSGS